MNKNNYPLSIFHYPFSLGLPPVAQTIVMPKARQAVLIPKLRTLFCRVP